MASRKSSLSLLSSPDSSAKSPTPAVAAPKRRFPAPVEYLFNEGDREVYGERYVALPKRLANEGVFREIADNGSVRGGASASSVLVPLMFHSWLDDAADPYSRWAFVPQRKLAAVSGVDRGTARRALARLVESGLAETRTVRPNQRDGGPDRVQYRLASSLFAKVENEKTGKRERHFRIGGTMLYGGVWSIMPRASARHLFLIVSLLDPVDSESEFVGALVAAGETPALARDRVHAMRQESPTSLATLAAYSGLAPSVVSGVLAVLTTPIFGVGLLGANREGVGMVARNEASGRPSYHPTIESQTYFFKPDSLNGRAARAQTVVNCWGKALRRAA